MSKEIILTKGKVAIVDDADFEWLNQWKWCYVSSGYAMRRQYLGGGRDNEKAEYILMHRLIIGANKKQTVDHINRDKLDCRRTNLRICTRQQNQCNSTLLRTNNTSGYRGVYWYKPYKKWMVSVSHKGTPHFGGYHDNPLNAAKAYNTMAVKLHGGFAVLNEV